MRRILVTGCGGSGKSTVARALGEILDLPVIHLDLLYWNAGWVPTPDDEFDAKLRDALTGDAWICDGNYGRTMEMRIERADAIWFLDLPRRTCVWRILRRPGTSRPDLPAGCPERRFNLDYARFVKWVWDYRKRSRPAVLELLERARETRTVYHLRDQASVDRMLDGLRRARSARR